MMQTHHLEFKISCLYKEKMILILESIGIFILALFVSVFLPQLLFQFVFSTQQLTAEPVVLKYIPVVSFIVAILYFLYAAVMLVMKRMKFMQLHKELSMMMTNDECSCDCDDCNHDDHAHHWMGDDSSENLDEMSSVMSKTKKSGKRKLSKKS